MGIHMWRNFAAATGLVIVLQVIVGLAQVFYLYLGDGMDRLVNDLIFGAFLVFLCGYPIIMYFLAQRSHLREMNVALEVERQKASKADVAKSEFLANMSHEIRTPMNGVMGMAELLAKTNLDSKQKMFTEVIVHSGESLLTIINDVLDFSKIESGQMKLDVAPFNLADVVEGVATLLSSKFVEKNIELVVRISPNLPESVVGDVGRVRQILVNILGNASKFTEVGYVLLDVSGRVDNKDRLAHLKIAIEDTGIGISTENCDKIFGKFSQADNSATRRHEGTGLGLSIASSLVALMGGRMGVESELGKGSVFWFEIDLPVHGCLKKKTIAKGNYTGARILLADDNLVNRSILSEQMSSWHFESEVASNGEDAVAMALDAESRDEGFDLVILDYQMPEMTGGDVVIMMQAYASIRHLPVIMLTSVDETESGESFVSLGIAGHLVKPTRSSLLYETIVKVLGETMGIDEDRVEKSKNTSQNIGEHLVLQKTEAPVVQNEAPVDQDEAPVDQDYEPIDILVAEDNDVNQILFRTILEDAGWSFKIAENGAEAVEFEARYQPKIILMDVSMPVMNGHEAARSIRKKEQGTDCHIPIVGVTAHAIEGDREKCIEAGMDDYLSKPISPDKLEEKINHWMAKTGVHVPSAEQNVLLQA